MIVLNNDNVTKCTFVWNVLFSAMSSIQVKHVANNTNTKTSHKYKDKQIQIQAQFFGDIQDQEQTVSLWSLSRQQRSLGKI